MAVLAESAAGLRIFGDDLDPEAVTRALGKRPTRSRKQGEPWHAPNGRLLGISRTGAWHLRAPRVSPGDLDAQVAAILEGTTEDLSVWRDLGARYRMDLFCGAFMQGSNEGLGLSVATLLRLAERGVALELDIYAPAWLDEGAEEEAQPPGG